MSRRSGRWRNDRRNKWRTSVARSMHYTGLQKRVLAATADAMRPDGWVEVERKDIAERALVKQPQRVSEAWSRARDVGHLIFITKMAYGQPTRYQGTVPDLPCDASCDISTHRGKALPNPRARKLTPPVVNGSAGHYTDESANPFTTEKVSPPVVNGFADTISKTRRELHPAASGASPPSDGWDEAATRTRSENDFDALGLRPRDDLADLIKHTSSHFVMPESEETG